MANTAYKQETDIRPLISRFTEANSDSVHLTTDLTNCKSDIAPSKIGGSWAIAPQWMTSELALEIGNQKSDIKTTTMTDTNVNANDDLPLVFSAQAGSEATGDDRLARQERLQEKSDFCRRTKDEQVTKIKKLQGELRTILQKMPKRPRESIKELDENIA